MLYHRRILSDIRIFVVLFLLSTPFSFGRIWTTLDGKSIDASLVKYQNGMVILKNNESGERILFSIEKLSPEDQTYIRNLYPDGERTPRKKPVLKEQPGKPDPVKLSHLRGKVVLIDFCSISNLTCRNELPQIVALYNRYHRSGFEIIGVSLDRSWQEMKSVQKRFGTTWPMTLDKQRSLVTRWGVSRLPTRVLVDQNGIIVADNIFAVTLEPNLKTYLGVK